MKRFIALLLSFCLIVVGCIHVTYAATKKPALSKTSVSLKVGKTTTITVKNASKKVTWHTSASGVVKLSTKSGKYKQTIKLIAKKAGSATITAKHKNKNYKCKVKVTKKSTASATKKPTTTKKPSKDNDDEDDGGFGDSENYGDKIGELGDNEGDDDDDSSPTRTTSPSEDEDDGDDIPMVTKSPNSTQNPDGGGNDTPYMTPIPYTSSSPKPSSEPDKVQRYLGIPELSDFGNDDYIKDYVKKDAPVHEHEYTSLDWQMETCTKDGWIIKKCDICDLLYLERRKATGHKWHEEKGKKATCITPGRKDLKYCEYCNEYISDGEVIPIDPNAHDVETVPEEKATCASGGMTAGTCCKLCNKILSGCQPTAKIAHQSSFMLPYEDDGNATCTSAGTETSVCKYGCGVKDTRTKGSPLGHYFKPNGKCVRCSVTEDTQNPGVVNKQHLLSNFEPVSPNNREKWRTRFYALQSHRIGYIKHGKITVDPSGSHWNDWYETPSRQNNVIKQIEKVTYGAKVYANSQYIVCPNCGMRYLTFYYSSKKDLDAALAANRGIYARCPHLFGSKTCYELYGSTIYNSQVMSYLKDDYDRLVYKITKQNSGYKHYTMFPQFNIETVIKADDTIDADLLWSNTKDAADRNNWIDLGTGLRLGDDIDRASTGVQTMFGYVSEDEKLRQIWKLYGSNNSTVQNVYWEYPSQDESDEGSDDNVEINYKPLDRNDIGEYTDGYFTGRLFDTDSIVLCYKTHLIDIDGEPITDSNLNPITYRVFNTPTNSMVMGNYTTYKAFNTITGFSNSPLDYSKVDELEGAGTDTDLDDEQD